jgi:hypothetical protein
MIKEESISKEWIEHVAKSGKADKILVEKTIRALILLEGLAVSELDFMYCWMSSKKKFFMKISLKYL